MLENDSQINKDWFHRHKLFLATIVILICGAGLLFQWKLNHYRARVNTDFPVHEQATLAAQSDMSDWKTYTNDQYGFEFKYPNIVTNVQFQPGRDVSVIGSEDWIGYVPFWASSLHTQDRSAILILRAKTIDELIKTEYASNDIKDLTEKDAVINGITWKILSFNLASGDGEVWPQTDFLTEHNSVTFQYSGPDYNPADPGFVLSPQEILSTFKFTNNTADLTKQLEDWSLYKTTDIEVGTGYCGGNEFDGSLKQLNSGVRYSQELNGLFLEYTPNYNKWSNEKFLSFGDESICGAGGIYPMHAYPDKLLWVASCGDAASIPNCDDTRKIVEDYFNK